MLRPTEAKNIISVTGFLNEPCIYFMEKDDSGKEEITDVYSRAKHLGCLTGNSLIHPFISCISLCDSALCSLPDSPLATRKTNLASGDKLPKRSEDFSAEPSSSLVSSLLHKYFPAGHDLPCALHFLLRLTSRNR